MESLPTGKFNVLLKFKKGSNGLYFGKFLDFQGIESNWVVKPKTNNEYSINIKRINLPTIAIIMSAGLALAATECNTNIKKVN
jgi:hypothetical protein